MKLYTELEVRKAIKADNWTHSENQILESLTPIELPSDEEIEDACNEELHLLPSEQVGFMLGAKWMKEQILNQNK